MLKTTITIHGYNQGQFNAFLGQLLTLADALGLPKEQSEAYKSLIRQEVWYLFEHPNFIDEKESNFEKVAPPPEEPAVA